MLVISVTNNDDGARDVPLNYDIYQISKREQTTFFVITSFAIIIITYLFYENILVCFLLMPVIFPLKKAYLEYQIKKRKYNLNLQFRDALYSISASISVGRQMPEALLEARDSMQLIYSEASPIVRELSYITKRLNINRDPEDEVLRDFASRSNIEDICNFVDVYFTCRETGADLERVVMKASEIIMERIGVYKEIQTLTAQKRFEAKILTAIPLIIILFLKITSPDYLAVMYDTILGNIIMTLSLGAMAFSYYLIIKITDIRL